MKPSKDAQSSTTDDRRQEERLEAGGRVRLTFGKVTVEGLIENLSSGGMFLVADGQVPLEVEYQAGDGEMPERARLVRFQRLPDGRTGWAIEFDRS